MMSGTLLLSASFDTGASTTFGFSVMVRISLSMFDL